MAGPKQLQNLRVSAEHINSTIVALHTVQLDSTGGIITGGAGSTQVSIKEILSSSGGSLIDSSNVSLGVTIRAGSAAGTEYTDGDVDASISGGALLFDNSSNTLRPVTLTRGLPVNVVAGSAASTIVTVSTGSVRVHQSTAADLNVTVAGYSTIVSVSTGSVRVHQSSAADLNVTVAGLIADETAFSTNTTTFAPIGGYVSTTASAVVHGEAGVLRMSSNRALWTTPVDSSGGTIADSTQRALRVTSVDAGGSTQVSVSTGSVRVHQSTAADLNVTVAGYSTIVSVSTGSVRVHQSTNTDLVARVFQGVGNSSGADAWPVLTVDSSNAVVKPGDSANNAIRVNIIAGAGSGGTAIADETAFSTNVTSLTPIGGYVSTTPSAVVHGEVGVVRMSSNRALWTTPVDSSGGVVTDSTQRALRVTSVDAGGSTQVSVSTGSIRVVQSSASELLVTASTGSVRVHQSTAADLNVTVAGYSTITSVSTGSVRVHQSTAADLNVTVAGYSTIVSVSTGSVRVHQSTAADLNVTVAGYSTITSVSTGSVRVHQSTAADLLATVRLQDSSAVAIGASTTGPSGGQSGLHVREVMPDLLSTTVTITSSAASGVNYSLISSAATPLRHKVYAYFVASTHTTPSTIVFYSSNAIARWAVQFGSGSSGVTGANLAISPPGFIFATDSANALTCEIQNVSTQVIARVSISYFTEA